MNNAKISLQSILLACYFLLIFAMIANLIYNYVTPQKNEILPASICLVVFVACFVSGIFNVFYFQSSSKLLYLTFMFYLFLPFSIPLLVLEIKYRDKINNYSLPEQSDFTKRFITVTTILQILELMLLVGFMLNFLLANSQELRTFGLYFLIPIILIIFGLVSSWVYFVTNMKLFKILMIFNFQFGLPWFFMSFIMTNRNNKSKNLQN